MAVRRARIGKHTLETLTTGMYTNALDSLREYVQNSSDAIDAARNCDLLERSKGEIEIQVDGRAHEIVIKDNGIGLSPDDARASLWDIGRSEKLGARFRGFRGIGRLGGLGYCTELVFKTKRAGDSVCYTQTWDARRLQGILSPSNGQDLEVDQVIDKVVTDHEETYRGNRKDHFFEVRMIGVHDDLLMQVDEVRSYLGQTCAVPFDNMAFRFGREIDKRLRESVPDYTTYDLRLGLDMVFKPYQDSVPLSRGPHRLKGEFERIESIEYVTLSGPSGAMAQGWFGKTALSGMIDPDSHVAGIRVRLGNMLIGDGRILERAFQKSNRRFASYLLGEIHIIDRGLVPNARRDDFEPTKSAKDLYEIIARDICSPASEAIRVASQQRSHTKKYKKAEELYREAAKHIEKGFVSEASRARLVDRLNETSTNLRGDSPIDSRQKGALREAAKRVSREAPSVVDLELQSRYDKKTRELLKRIFDMLYAELDDEMRAERIIRRIVSKLAQG